MPIVPLSRKYKVWFFIAFSSLVIAGILGSLLRLAFVIDLPLWVNYKNVLHAHSHVAMMGWIFGGLYIFIIHYFELTRKVYITIFWLVQLSVAGMLASFPVQGYGLVSIIFTTLHLFLSYIFVYNIFKDLSTDEHNVLSRYATLFLKTAGLFLVVSTMGTWALGIIMNTSFKGSALYYASIQFFLHFQFNGWFIFAMLSIFLKLCSKHMILDDIKGLGKAYWYLLASCILTYALSVTWSTPEDLIFWINSIGVILQAVALYYIIRSVHQIWPKIKKHISTWTKTLFTIAFYGLVVKITIQTLVAIPYLATISYTIKNFVIGFIHLLMLGTLTSFLIGNFEQCVAKKKYSFGIWLFLTGFAFTETILFLQGLMLWKGMGFLPYYYTIILLASMLMPLGFILYMWQKRTELNSSSH